MKLDAYQKLKRQVIAAGYGSEIEWATNIKPPTDALSFWREYAWVVLNSGMREQIARTIWERIRPIIEAGGSASEGFGHPGKGRAIDEVYAQREDRFYLFAITHQDDMIEELRRLPWIGPITCYHLAKNLGVDVCKPDRHLVRIAALSGETAQAMCARLAYESKDRVRVVDSVIWRAANLGIV